MRACTALLLGVTLACHALAEDDDDWDAFAPIQVSITPQLPGLHVLHRGERVWVQRNQDPSALIEPAFALTSRACPPFCLQPMVLADGIQTLGELEMLDYLGRLGRVPDMLVVDARSSPEYREAAIPGAINTPWTDLVEAVGAVEFIIEERLSDFGGERAGSSWDFSAAKTLVIYDNGPWCGQAASMIRALLRFDYPADKIKWFRGGLQDWHTVGLTVIAPDTVGRMPGR